MALDFLTQHRDGLAGFDLGVVGACQYALSFRDHQTGDVFRRRANDVGSYGGWRWECAAEHPARYAEDPVLGVLATRIAAVTQALNGDPVRVRALGVPAQVHQTAPSSLEMP